MAWFAHSRDPPFRPIPPASCAFPREYRASRPRPSRPNTPRRNFPIAPLRLHDILRPSPSPPQPATSISSNTRPYFGASVTSPRRSASLTASSLRASSADIVGDQLSSLYEVRLGLRP